MDILISDQRSAILLRKENFDRSLISIKKFIIEHYNPKDQVIDPELILEAETLQAALDIAMFKYGYNEAGDMISIEYVVDKRPPADDAPFAFMQAFFKFMKP